MPIAILGQYSAASSVLVKGGTTLWLTAQATLAAKSREV
jgi:hypothetical protein